MRFTKAAVLVAAGVALTVGLAACGPALIRIEEPTQTYTPAIDAGSAEALNVQLRIGVGELTVHGDSDKAMDARFDYRPESWKPRVDYSVEGTTGQLRVEQPAAHTGFNGHNTWDVRLSRSLPLALQVNAGVGTNTLDLADVTLQRLEYDGGVGDSTIDLGSVARRDATVRINGGVGSIRLIVPREAGVRVWGEKDGVGNFSADGFMQRYGEGGLVNENYGKPGVKTIDVSVQRGVGDVTIEQR
jgi:hypothetical protein